MAPSWDVLARPGAVLGRFGDVLEPSWGRLGTLLGPLGALLGLLGAVLEPLGALLEPSWGRLGRLKRKNGEVAKTYKNPRKINVFGTSGGPRWGQDGPKLGSSCGLEPSCGLPRRLHMIFSSSFRLLLVFFSS